MDAHLCALCECLSHLLSLSHDSILADEYSANSWWIFQRILSPLRGYLLNSTTHYQVVFTDVSAVKASYVRLGTGT